MYFRKYALQLQPAYYLPFFAAKMGRNSELKLLQIGKSLYFSEHYFAGKFQIVMISRFRLHLAFEIGISPKLKIFNVRCPKSIKPTKNIFMIYQNIFPNTISSIQILNSLFNSLILHELFKISSFVYPYKSEQYSRFTTSDNIEDGNSAKSW